MQIGFCSAYILIDSFQYCVYINRNQVGSPGRALWILILFIGLFTIFYYKALTKFDNTDGIWCKCNEQRSSKPELLHAKGLHALLLAFYFSLLSGFSIGWLEINVGNRIQRIQTRDYSLHATRWVRRVAGIQSLISLYLVVIWILTYFGRPFE